MGKLKCAVCSEVTRDIRLLATEIVFYLRIGFGPIVTILSCGMQLHRSPTDERKGRFQAGEQAHARALKFRSMRTVDRSVIMNRIRSAGGTFIFSSGAL
jgi:hypothetical protein